MHFKENKIASLTAVAAVLSAGCAAPAAALEGYTISDELADQLDRIPRRGLATYTIADDLAARLNLAENDAVPAMLEARADHPPSIADFYNFAEEQGEKHGDKLVFWAGTGGRAAADFAKKHDRITLQDLIANKWEKFQTAKTYNGYWDTAEDAASMFWRPLSSAFAEYARDEVWVLIDAESEDMSTNSLTDNSRPECVDCWNHAEKPMLVANLHSQKSPKVTKIQKFSRHGDADGEITTV